MTTAQHTPGPKVYFNLQTVSLHWLADGETPLKRNQLLSLPRDSDLGEGDPNVMVLRAMEAAGREAIAKAEGRS